GRLGQLANDQFDIYRVHFAGLSRLSRRPELLERVVETLEHILSEMQRLTAAGFSVDFNARNQEIVRDRLATYQQELEEVRAVRMDASLPEVMDALAIGVNALLSEYGERYAGKPRTEVEPQRLSELCDLMGELEQQMHN